MLLRSCILLLLFTLFSGVAVAQTDKTIALPRPSVSGSSSLEQLLAQRRSTREYKRTALELAEIGQLLWAAQGITHAHGFRTAPSAGALYPLELYIVANQVHGLAKGVYHYDPRRHQLLNTSTGDMQALLSRAASSQESVQQASAVIAFTADYQRTTRKYGNRGVRYVHIEVGHAAQNLFLQAESLGLGTVDVGAFADDTVARVLQLPADLQPLLLMPVGRK